MPHRHLAPENAAQALPLGLLELGNATQALLLCHIVLESGIQKCCARTVCGTADSTMEMNNKAWYGWRTGVIRIYGIVWMAHLRSNTYTEWYVDSLHVKSIICNGTHALQV